MSEAVPPDWGAYWQQDIESIDTSNFNDYIKDFIPKAREKVDIDEFMVFLYEILHAHMSAAVMYLVVESKMAVMALPYHNLKTIQSLDVSVFGPCKKAARTCIDKSAKRYANCSPIGVKLNTQNVLSSIADE